MLLAGIAFLLPPANAQEKPPNRADSSFSFDVISIRPERNQEGTSYRISFREEAFEGKSATVSQLVEYAYSVPPYRIDWSHVRRDETLYSIRAKISPELAEYLSHLKDEDSFRIRKRLVQKLLEERFGLVAHEELKNGLAYTLSVSKSGAKLDPTSETRVYQPDELKSAKPQVIILGAGSLHAEALTMDELTEYLSDELGSPVANRTKLHGSFQFSLKWASDTNGLIASMFPRARAERLPARTSSDNSESSRAEEAPSLASALKEQLGLILQKEKVAISYLVIDSLHASTTN